MFILLALIGFWPQLGMASAIEASSTPRLALADQVFWCSSPADMGIAEISTGHCAFEKTTGTALARGFSDAAFWLRIELHNPETNEIERWLQIGHPRLQQVSLFYPLGKNAWHRNDTGTLTPVNQHPILATYPVFPLKLKAGEYQTYYVRVASKTSIDLTPTLWLPNSYTAIHQSGEFFKTLVFGGLFTAAIFTLLAYLKLRDRIYLYFGLSTLFEFLFDASYAGFIPIYVWPSDLPFDNRVMLLAAGLMLMFFVLFVRQFVGDMRRYRRYDIALLTSVGVLVLAVLWAVFAGVGKAAQVMSISTIVVLLCGIAMFFRSWRDGSLAAGYLLLSYTMLALIISYPVVVAFGGGNFPDTQSYIYLFRFLIITPLVLASIALRSKELNEARRQAASRVQFMAQMSHEFRTPLNTMLGFAELLERDSKRITVQEGGSAIKRSCRYLLGMIDEILDHARGEAGQLTLSFAPVFWPDFISALEQSTAMTTRPRGNRFELIQELDIPETVIVDERRLRQVLDILLSNANRYTQHSTIKLHCATLPSKNHIKQLAFSVSDNGAGVATEELERIFQPFVRGNAGKNSGIDGTGIGLAIAQQLVTLMGGNIGVESQLGEGSRFYFTINYTRAEHRPKSMINIEQNRLPRAYTILLVDDEPNNCHLLSALLSDCGFNVLTEGSGKAAQHFFKSKVDLVITDQFMPDGDGWSVLRDWTALQVPVILLSSAPPQRPKSFPKSVNFASVQLKPFNADALLEVISELLAIKWLPAETAPPAPIIKVNCPPMELLSPLRVMIEDGAVTDIADWLASFIGQHPEYTAYCAQIAASNLALDFDMLRSLTNFNLPLSSENVATLS